MYVEKLRVIKSSLNSGRNLIANVTNTAAPAECFLNKNLHYLSSCKISSMCVVAIV